MAFEGADPAFLRDDDRHRLTLDHRPGDVIDGDIRRHRQNWCGGGPIFVSGPYFFLRSRICAAIVFHCLASSPSNAFDLALFLGQIVVFAAQLHFLEAPQAAQPRIEDIGRLHIGKIEACLQFLLWIVRLADDARSPGRD